MVADHGEKVGRHARFRGPGSVTGYGGQIEGERGPGAGPAFHREAPLAGFDDSPGDGQAQSGALGPVTPVLADTIGAFELVHTPAELIPFGRSVR